MVIKLIRILSLSYTNGHGGLGSYKINVYTYARSGKWNPIEMSTH